MKTANNKIAKSITQPGEANQVAQPMVHVKFKLTTAWQDISPKIKNWDKSKQMWMRTIWCKVIPFMGSFKLNDEALGDIWEQMMKEADNHHNGECNTKADWWQPMVQRAVITYLAHKYGLLTQDEYENKQ